MTFEQAEQLAAAHVRIRHGDGLALIPGSTIVRPYGWVFFSNSHEYIRTRAPEDCVLGCGGLLVTIQGDVRVLGTAHPVSWYLDRYESSPPPGWQSWGGRQDTRGSAG